MRVVTRWQLLLQCPRWLLPNRQNRMRYYIYRRDIHVHVMSVCSSASCSDSVTVLFFPFLAWVWGIRWWQYRLGDVQFQFQWEWCWSGRDWLLHCRILPQKVRADFVVCKFILVMIPPHTCTHVQYTHTHTHTHTHTSVALSLCSSVFSMYMYTRKGGVWDPISHDKRHPIYKDTYVHVQCTTIARVCT